MNEKLEALNQEIEATERSYGGHSMKKRYWNTR